MQSWVLMAPLVFQLACVLQGEAGIMGQEAMEQVAQTIVARMESPDFPATLEEVLEQYYGHENPPSEEAYLIAERVVAGRLPAGPYLYVYSDRDMARKGWRQGDLIYEAEGWRLHFTKTAPWEPKQEEAMPPPIVLACALTLRSGNDLSPHLYDSYVLPQGLCPQGSMGECAGLRANETISQ